MRNVSGLNEVIKRLNAEIKKIKNGSEQGLVKAGLLVRRESQLKTPVDTGNLKASAYTDPQRTSRGMIVEIGYTSEYAPWVHEMPGKLKGQPRASFGATSAGKEFGGGTGKGFYWDPQGKAEPYFLKKALVESEPKILGLIKDKAKIK